MPRKSPVYGALIRCCESGVMNKCAQPLNAVGSATGQVVDASGAGSGGPPGLRAIRRWYVLESMSEKPNRFKSSNGGDF